MNNTMISGSTSDWLSDVDLGNISINISSGSTGTDYIYTTTGTETITFPDYMYSGTNTLAPLHVNGDAVIEGELSVNGVKLSERLDKIEERLGILRPNEELEEKWEELRKLRNKYTKLENEILEKEKVWGILKK